MLDAEGAGRLYIEEGKIKTLLSLINSPEDLKKLNLKELEELAREIREYILRVVSKTGGHLASSLGVVELAIALHYVFDSPKDKIIWDVGHQCYPHKILTGRRLEFTTLRQKGGISGFPKITESEHDHFGTGHACTAISAALGMAVARDLQGKDYKVIAVVGDGSLTGGMAWEALNHAGEEKRDLIVILNDNEFSISPTSGALSHYLSRKLADPTYLKIREEIRKHLSTKPGGDAIVSLLKRMEESFKSFFTPGVLFEELGFKYVGPVRGHHLKELISTLRQVKKASEPILVHVLTQKGKGYKPAEADPSSFHGISPFHIETAQPIKERDSRTYTKAFSEALVKIAEKNPKIVAITAAMPDGTGLSLFARKFPERFFDVGIAEQHAVTFAAGLASQGMIPVCAIYSTFLQRAYDQIVHDVALQNLHVVFALDRAGIVGEDGPTHHGAFDLSYLRHIPNMIVAVPKDEEELAHLLYTAINGEKPFALRYPKGKGTGKTLPESFKEIPVGTAEVLKEGRDLLILAVGPMVYEAEKAAKLLAEEGIDATVVNARFVKPLDEELIADLASQTRKVLTVEENSVLGGFGSAVWELLVQKGITFKGRMLGLPDRFVGHGKASELRKELGLSAEGIIKKAKELL